MTQWARRFRIDVLKAESMVDVDSSSRSTFLLRCLFSSSANCSASALSAAHAGRCVLSRKGPLADVGLAIFESGVCPRVLLALYDNIF